MMGKHTLLQYSDRNAPIRSGSTLFSVQGNFLFGRKGHNRIFMPKKLEGHNALARPSVSASQFFYVTVSFKPLKLGS